MRDDDRESGRFFRTRLCLYIELFRQESVSRRAFSLLWILPLLLKSLALKVHFAGEEEFQNPHSLSIMTDSAHNVHTNTVAFSPSVLIKCSICSDHPLKRERLKKTIHGI